MSHKDWSISQEQMMLMSWFQMWHMHESFGYLPLYFMSIACLVAEIFNLQNVKTFQWLCCSLYLQDSKVCLPHSLSSDGDTFCLFNHLLLAVKRKNSAEEEQ